MPKQWEIWYANFAFEDNPSVIKKRPVLILDNHNFFPILVAKVTKSESRPGYWGEYRIIKWQEAGLDYPSTIRLSKRLILKRIDFAYKIGTLSHLDILNLRELIQSSPFIMKI